MINLDTLKNIFKKATTRHRIPDRRMMHPNREWGVGLLLLVCILVVGGIYASLVFKRYSAIDVSTENVEVETVRYNRADALKALEIYNEKQNTYDALLMDQPSVVIVAEDEDTPEQNLNQLLQNPDNILTVCETQDILVCFGSGRVAAPELETDNYQVYTLVSNEETIRYGLIEKETGILSELQVLAEDS